MDFLDCFPVVSVGYPQCLVDLRHHWLAGFLLVNVRCRVFRLREVAHESKVQVLMEFSNWFKIIQFIRKKKFYKKISLRPSSNFGKLWLFLNFL